MEFNDYLVRIYNGESLIFEPDGTVSPTSPDNGYSFGLGELQQIVGGWIELISASDRIKLVVNEKAQHLCFPFNEKATQTFAIYLRGTVLACQRTRLE